LKYNTYSEALPLLKRRLCIVSDHPGVWTWWSLWTNGQSAPTRQEARGDQGQMSEEEKLVSSQEIVGQEGITGHTLIPIREHLIIPLYNINVCYIWPMIRGFQTKSGNKKNWHWHCPDVVDFKFNLDIVIDKVTLDHKDIGEGPASEPQSTLFHWIKPPITNSDPP
jgi:hypothetical protein